MSGSISNDFKKDFTPSKSGSISNNWKRDWNRDTNFERFKQPTPGKEPDPVYYSMYETGFPTQWGAMSGPMMPLQSIDGWQLNPSQIDALMAAGMGQQGVAMPIQGSFLARLAALQNGGRNVS